LATVSFIGGGVKNRNKRLQQEISEALIYSDYFSKKMP